MEVAPLAGAWIEISFMSAASQTYKSLPLRERGLKFTATIEDNMQDLSLPLRERGLK